MTLNRQQAIETDQIRHSSPHFFNRTCPYLTRASENEGEFPAANLWDSHSSSSRNESQLGESAHQQSHSSQFVENPIQHILNMQRYAMNSLTAMPNDEFITFSHNDDSEMMGQNLFSTFLHPPSLAEPCTSSQAVAESSLASARMDGPSTTMGSQSSVTEPLLEMGFSIKHVKKAIDATGEWLKHFYKRLAVEEVYLNSVSVLGNGANLADSTVNQLASWMIEHPDIDDNGNRANSVLVPDPSAAETFSIDDMEFSAFGYQSQVLIYSL